VDPSSLAAFKTAREAYFRGDFDLAELQAKHVQSPALQNAVNQLLANIGVYRDVMKQADAMVHNGDLKGAEQKYQFAVTIQQNGPGNPVERLKEVQAEEARAATEKPQAAVQSQTAAQSKATQPPPKINNTAKIKNSLDTARREETQHDLKAALQAHNAALSLDARQAEAIAGKKRVLSEMQEDSNAMKDSLKKGVANFYASNFSHADDAIDAYLQSGEKHYAGAAHFYLGASLLTQALLTSPKTQLQVDTLREQALDQFALAKQLHYKPLESAVSPKVFAQWMQTGERQ
jgi:hypothetical protein